MTKMNSVAKMICPMKQFFSYLGASLAAIAALASCNKEIEAPVEDLKGGVPFEICASADGTKTAIDKTFKTTWVVDGTADQINVYHKEASATEYTYDNAFTAQTVDGKFSGELTSALETGKEYQWLAKYPYDSYLTTPAKGYSYIGSRSDQTQSQTGVNNTAHLSGYYMPLVGKGTSVGTASPTITMEHASSVIEINVTNNTTEALDVTSIVFTAPKSIIGQFVIDYTGETTTYTEKNYVSAIATLSVTDGTIAAGESGKFYIAIKPFSATSEQKLSLSVNGYSKEIPHSSDVTFTAGKIKKINFNYDKVVADYVTIPWKEDFSGNLDIYSLVSTTSATRTYNETSAGGTAPELLVAKNNGSFSAKVKASAGDYVLTFMSNHADYLSISIDNEAITLTKVSDTEYSLSISDGVDFFNVTFTNINSSNTRLDNIELVSSNRTVLGTPVVTASLNNTDASVTNSIDVTWNAVEKAGSYVVTAIPATGSAVSETVNAVENTTTYEHTFSGLAYEIEYTISVVAKPSDTTLYLDSAAGVAEGTVTTGANPSPGGGTKYFVKVTSIPADWSGEYLIVYETDKVAFDGSLTKLDAVSNTVDVSISDSKIEATEALLNSTFTINAGGTTILSKSGYYIGNNSNSNALTGSSTELTNTLSFESNGDFNVISKGGAYLRYNATSRQTRFRYFKSSSYTGQKAIQLYKLAN